MSFAHNQKLPWTDAKRQELRKLWPTHSAAQCAVELFTPEQLAATFDNGRSAVMGMVDRLELPGKASSPHHQSDRKFISKRAKARNRRAK